MSANRTFWQVLSSFRLRRSVWLILAVLLVQLAGLLPAAFAQSSGIASPGNGAVVQGQVQITGTAVHPDFLRYELFFGPCPVSGAEWCGIGDAVFQQVQGGLLGVWNTTAIPDGTYQIQMRVVKKDGNYETYLVSGVTVANTQPVTPTPAATETPGTGTPTPTPGTGTPPATLVGGTPTVIIEQPPTSTPRARGTPSEVAGGTGSDDEESGSGRGDSGLPQLPTQEEVAAFFDGARRTMCWGAQVGLGAIVVIVGYVAFRNTLRAAYRKVRRKGRRLSAR
jgi:hypothetical protein